MWFLFGNRSARMRLGVSVSFFLVMFLLLTSTVAQDAPSVISAENINNLQSVAQINFADLPAEAGSVQTGWFALSRDGERITVKNRDEALITLDLTGKIIDQYSLPGSDGLATTIEDAAYNPTGDQLASVNLEGGHYYVVYRSLAAGSMEYYRFETQDIPLRVWWDSNVWLEVAPFDSSKPRYVMQLNPLPLNRLRENDVLNDSEMTILPSGPENDPESFLRIGRIAPPLAVTVTQDGLTKRWNLETNTASAQAKVDTMPGAGQISSDGYYFVWREGDSKALHLLDFETGEDRVIAPLEGAYLPFLLLTPAADVAMAVNPGQQAVVTAWNTTTGERTDLGEFRMCTREPDMVRLSRDGSTLVIGCDTGLDIWRVKSGKS